MVSIWARIRSRQSPPSREEVEAVQTREVAEAKRQELERAIKYRKAEISGLVDGVIPKRGIKQ